MKDITKQVKHGTSHSMETVLEQITASSNKIQSLQAAFNSNPSRKTATPLSNERQNKVFLEEALKHTSGYKLIRKEEAKATVVKLAEIVAPNYRVVFK